MRFDLGSWILELATAGGTVFLGWALSVMRRNRDAAHQVVESRLKELETVKSDHVTQLAVLRTCQENTAERLDSIDAVSRDTNMKLDSLIQVILKKG